MSKMDLVKMLKAGQELGLETVGDAYSQVRRYYDVYFSSENDWQEVRDFDRLLLESPLVEQVKGKPQVIHMSIDSGLMVLEIGHIPTYAELLNKLCENDAIENGGWLNRNRIAVKLRQYTPELGRNKRNNDVYKAIWSYNRNVPFIDQFNRKIVMP